MSLTDKLLLLAMGVILFAVATIIVLAWEVPDASPTEETAAVLGDCLSHHRVRF